jgi:hypothetical protein
MAAGGLCKPKQLGWAGCQPLFVLSMNGFSCRIEDELPIRVDPVIDPLRVEIGQFADAGREQLMKADPVVRPEPEVLQGIRCSDG